MMAQLTPILIIESDHAVGDTLQRALTEAGYATARVVDGRQALHWLSRTRPVFVLLDPSLPDLSAEAVAAAVRGRYGDDLPIAVLAAGRRGDPRLPPIRAITVLPTPLVLADLLRTISRVVG